MDNKYDSLENYVRDYISRHDFYLYDDEFCTSTYNMILKQLETEYQIIKIDIDKYITKRKLDEIGITKKMIYDFIELIKENVKKDEFFTLYSMEKVIELSDIYEYGFDDIFYESILINSNLIQTTRFQNKVIMIFSTKQNIKQNDMVIYLLKEKQGYIIEDLIEIFDRKYGISLDRQKLLTICYEENLYYNRELEKIYLNKDQWYEEVYDNV